MTPLTPYQQQALNEIRESNTPKLMDTALRIQAITKNIDLRSMGAKEAK